MPLPQDHDTLCRWSMFAVKYWLIDIHPHFSCICAVMLGMNMRRADFMEIVRVYVDHKDNSECNGPCDPDFNLKEWMR
jgi:hypothetical protein